MNQVDDIGNIAYENTFELCSQLASAGFRLLGGLPNVPGVSNPDILFILNNTLNDVVIHSEDLYSLILKQDEGVLKKMKQLLLITLVIMAVTSLLILIILLQREYSFISKRFRFFFHFARISDTERGHIVQKTSRFYSLLSDSSFSEEFIMVQMQAQETKRKKTVVNVKSVKPEAKSVETNAGVRRKEYDSRNINRSTCCGFLSLLVFLSCFWVVYGLLYAFLVRNDAIIQKKKHHIIQTNLLRTRLSEAITTLYSYIGYDSISDVMVRNRPLSVEWEANYDKIIGSNTFVSKLASENFEALDNKIKTLLLGDLCSLIPDTITECYSDGYGAKTHGIIGLNNYFFSGLRSLKDEYDNSNKNETAKISVFGREEYGAVERVYFETMLPAYEKLEGDFQENLLLVLARIKKTVLITNVLALVFFVFLGRVYWVIGLRKMQKDKEYFGQMLKLIPINVLMKNKGLKTYLLNEIRRNGDVSDGLLAFEGERYT